VGDASPRTGDARRIRADAVVIGSGAGGGPAAAVLAEAGFEVVVLEAGPRYAAADFGARESQMRARLGRFASSSDGLQNFYAGACVGGSTVVNDALCWRPPAEVLAAWRDGHGLAELDEAAFAPYVERALRDVHAEPTDRAHTNRNAWLLGLGARRLGWANQAMDRNVRGCANLGRCNFGCPIDAKQSTLVAYVPRAERAGARVLPNLRAERIELDAGAVTGVEALRIDPATKAPAGRLRVDAPLVVVAAGALETGPLLRRSGIDGAGEGFQAHSSAYVTARFAEPVHGYFGPTMAWAISHWSDVGGHDGPGYMLENTAVHAMQTAAVLPGFGPGHERAMRALPHLAHAVVVLRDRARGRVRSGSDGSPRIDYALTGPDLERMRHAFASAARAWLAAGALEVWLPIEGYGPVTRDADLERLAQLPLDRSRLTLLYAVHLFGGAAMSARRAGGVCDPEGACWNARGLYVADAAALPSNTGVNPQVTIMANALRVAERAAASRRPA
jgi:choline dehydrogenase-like flavoprotein